MRLLNDIHHLTFITADLDRLIGFYKRVFEAPVTVDIAEQGLRHAFIEVGPHTVLHPFEIPVGALPVLSRCSIAAVSITSRSAPRASRHFASSRRRLVAEGASDGVITDMGSLFLFSFNDPDGGRHEVVWVKPGVPIDQGLRVAEWKTAEMA